MTNRRCSMDTQSILVVEDATILPTNPQQERQNHFLERPSVSIAVEEREKHGTTQGVKPRCTSKAPETFEDLLGLGKQVTKLENHSMVTVCSKKTILFRPPRRISNCHHSTNNRIQKDINIMFKL